MYGWNISFPVGLHTPLFLTCTKKIIHSGFRYLHVVFEGHDELLHSVFTVSIVPTSTSKSAILLVSRSAN